MEIEQKAISTGLSLSNFLRLSAKNIIINEKLPQPTEDQQETIKVTKNILEILQEFKNKTQWFANWNKHQDPNRSNEFNAIAKDFNNLINQTINKLL